jgi:hypothetical protein
VALGQVSIRVLRFFPVSIIPTRLSILAYYLRDEEYFCLWPQFRDIVPPRRYEREQEPPLLLEWQWMHCVQRLCLPNCGAQMVPIVSEFIGLIVLCESRRVGVPQVIKNLSYCWEIHGYDGRSLRNSELSSSSFPCVISFISYHGWGWRFYEFVLSLALLFNIFVCIIIIIFLSSLLRPVTGVIKLNPSIFSKVCLNFFSLLVGILESFRDPVRAHPVSMQEHKLFNAYITENVNNW